MRERRRNLDGPSANHQRKSIEELHSSADCGLRRLLVTNQRAAQNLSQSPLADSSTVRILLGSTEEVSSSSTLQVL